jgi:hypothetical protein
LVSQQGVTTMSELHPDLMAASGFEIDLHQAPIDMLVQYPVMEACFLELGVRSDHNFGAAAFPCQLVDPTARRFRKGPFDNGEVAFLDGAIPELFAQTRGRLGCACKHNHPGHRAIQSMDQAQKNSPRFLVLFFQPALSQFQQGDILCGIALNQESRWLIKSEQMIVCIQYWPVAIVASWLWNGVVVKHSESPLVSSANGSA